MSPLEYYTSSPDHSKSQRQEIGVGRFTIILAFVKGIGSNADEEPSNIQSDMSIQHPKAPTSLQMATHITINGYLRRFNAKKQFMF